MLTCVLLPNMAKTRAALEKLEKIIKDNPGIMSLENQCEFHRLVGDFRIQAENLAVGLLTKPAMHAGELEQRVPAGQYKFRSDRPATLQHDHESPQSIPADQEPALLPFMPQVDAPAIDHDAADAPAHDRRPRYPQPAAPEDDHGAVQRHQQCVMLSDHRSCSSFGSRP